MLDENKSIQDNVGQGRETITINGKSKHVLGYLQDFLFSPQQARAPIKKLSGGERNRAMLAKLFTQPANVIVMDEPTNDLDIETLELLESLLVEFEGTLLIVSHDRVFLNNVVTSTIAFEGEGEFKEYVGGYDDYLRQHQKTKAGSQAKLATSPSKPITKSTAKKLNHKQQRELELLPKKVELLEVEIQALQQQMLEPNFYQQSQDEIKAISTRLNDTQLKLNEAFKRWEELED
jgi:ABC transport system ATP-binding/permease protein